MSPVVSISGECLAVGTEVSVVAHGALVSIASDVVSLVFAERTITTNVLMRHRTTNGTGDVLVDRRKTVTGMDMAGALDTGIAVIPVGAVQALVANTIDVLLFVSF